MTMNGYNFTERVRKVLANARVEAGRLQSPGVETEHILLGLLAEGEGIAAAVLDSFDVNKDALRTRLESGYRTGEGLPDGIRELPYSRAAKKVLEHSMAEARQLQHSYVGTEHLLLGLIQEKTGRASVALEECGLSRDRTAAEVLRLLGNPDQRQKTLISPVWETNADRELIARYNLKPHPEGGFFREHFRSEIVVNVQGKEYAASTAIYYLLRHNEISKWHVITADEVWHAYLALQLELLDYDPHTRKVKKIILGSASSEGNFAYTIRAGHWQAARSLHGPSLMGCTVAPGFEFSEFKLVRDIPGHDRAFGDELAAFREHL